MAHKIIIAGVAGLSGEYDINLDYFTNRELHTIKTLTGLRVGEFDEALNAGDSDLLVAFAALALRRQGKQFTDDMLWDAEAGAIRVMVDGADEEASPLDGNSGVSPTTSGPDSTTRSESQESDPSHIGVPV